VVDLKLPRSDAFTSMTDRDWIKIEKFQKHKSIEVKLNVAESFIHQINHALIQNFSELTYTKGRFKIDVDPRYFLIISKQLQLELGMPSRKIVGKVTGTSIKTEIVNEERIDYLDFYEKVPKKKTYRIPPRYYQTAKEIRQEFARQGLNISESGDIIRQDDIGFILVSSSLRKKLVQDQAFSQILLFCKAVAPSHVGDEHLPLLKIIPLNRTNENHFSLEQPQYKALTHASELNQLQFKLTNEQGHAINFSGNIILSLHIRNVSNKSAML
jgi:hypothetical protein